MEIESMIATCPTQEGTRAGENFVAASPVTEEPRTFKAAAEVNATMAEAGEERAVAASAAVKESITSEADVTMVEFEEKRPLEVDEQEFVTEAILVADVPSIQADKRGPSENVFPLLLRPQQKVCKRRLQAGHRI